MSAYAKAGKDASGLGRAVWTVFDYNGHKLRVVTAYRPCKKTKERTKGNKLSHSVWRQHYRYYKDQGIREPKPRVLFDKYLFNLIKQWRAGGEKVILAIDANENVYKGKFAEGLNQAGVKLDSAFTRIHKTQMPASHITGSEPIMAFLVSPDVDVDSYFIGRHKLGVGDHRGPHFLDIPLACFLGSKDIRPHSIRGRNL